MTYKRIVTRDMVVAIETVRWLDRQEFLLGGSFYKQGSEQKGTNVSTPLFQWAIGVM